MKLCRMPTEWANAAAVMSDVWSVNSQKNVFFPLVQIYRVSFSESILVQASPNPRSYV